MPLDQRVCPPCGTVFTPRRVDQIFHLRECRDGLYDAEYLALFFDYAVVLSKQKYQCFFCEKPAYEITTRPLFLMPQQRAHLVAACQPCKNNYYMTKFVFEIPAEIKTAIDVVVDVMVDTVIEAGAA